MKVGVVGGVSSTKILIEKLAQHGFKDVHVWGYQPIKIENVSGWCDLRGISNVSGFQHSSFVKVVDCENEIKKYNPDILFVVGLSQIVPASIMEIPRFGSLGFHPTSLPKGRGRAPIAWLILKESHGAATFFSLRAGVDDGPIVAQEFFDVLPVDDARDIEKKLLISEGLALDSLLPALNKNGELAMTEQDHSVASWYGRRSPEDGWINWGCTAHEIQKLIRASTLPHPGAFTYSETTTIKIWKAQVINEPYMGVVGRILRVDTDSFLVQTGDGLLEISEWSSSVDWCPRVGIMLGYYVESEVYNLHAIFTSLQARVSELEKIILGMKNHSV